MLSTLSMSSYTPARFLVQQQPGDPLNECVKYCRGDDKQWRDGVVFKHLVGKNDD